MSQLVLPQTIDAGTPLSATEVQQNFTAIGALINGNIEGGSGVNGNVKAKGLTSREADATLLHYAGATVGVKHGIETYTDFLVTPGAGLVLNYSAGTAFVTDDGSVHTSGLLLPAAAGSGTVTIASNASGNPRIDQIVLTMTSPGVGAVSVLQGTASVGATLENRTGAASLSGAARELLWDVLVPSGFAGPFVMLTHLRSRRMFAKPQDIIVSAVSSVDIPVSTGPNQVLTDTYTDRLLKLTYDITTSNLVSLAMTPDGQTVGGYSRVGETVNQTSVPATTAADTGQYSDNNGFALALAPVGSVAGGSRMSGSSTIGMFGSVKLGISTSVVQSPTGSGNQVINTQVLAQRLDIATGFSFWRVIPAGGGTFTGVLRVERY
jgi:hypothetical protein